MKKYRKHIRIPGFDYRTNGAYFITICSENRLPLFGKVENGKVVLSSVGKVVDNFWQKYLIFRLTVLWINTLLCQTIYTELL